jgi:endonuclease/exonuclease/phosphatase (EEP) superfamily protein YafD
LLHFHAIRPRSANTVAYQQVEFDALAAWSREIIQSGQNSLIVIGDFNSTPWHSDFRQLIKNSGLVNAQNGFGIQTSWHGNFPFWLRIPIDHCLHSKSLRTIRYTVGSNIGSDHLPLLVELQF